MSLSVVKLCCMGDGGVGKTSITIQLCSNHFVEMYDPTIEDSYRKQMVIDGDASLLEILDTAGQEELTAMRDQWIRGAEGYILVYSVTSRTSLEQINSFRQQIIRVQDSDDVPMIIVGNKCDLVQSREVSTDEGKELARSFGAEFIEASAKTRTNIEQIFISVVRRVRQKQGFSKKSSKEMGGKGGKGNRRKISLKKECLIL